MPLQSAILFLAAIILSTILLGATFKLRSKYNAPFLNIYFYFIIAVVSYGFINWVGPTLIFLFRQMGAESSTNTVILFIAFLIPLALIKLVLFIIFLLCLLKILLKKSQIYSFGVFVFLSLIIAAFLLIKDHQGGAIVYSQPFIILFGILTLIANYLSIFYFLAKADRLKDKSLIKYARQFGWAYLVGYFIYASPYYLDAFITLPWYPATSPYFYYILHLVPIFFLNQLVNHKLQIYSMPKTPNENLNLLAAEYDISKRERTILDLLLAGKNNDEIAGQLFISPHTVRNHVYNIYGKFNVKNRLQLNSFCDNSRLD